MAKLTPYQLSDLIPLISKAVDQASDWLIANLGTVNRQSEDIKIDSNVHWLPTSKKGRGSLRRCYVEDRNGVNLYRSLFRYVVAILYLQYDCKSIPLTSPDHMNILMTFVDITYQAVQMLLSSQTLDFHWTRQYWVPVSLPAAFYKTQPTARQ